MSETLMKLGFTKSIKPIPLFDWDAVVRVIGSMFFILLAVNVAYMGLVHLRGLTLEEALMPSPPRAIGYSLIATLNYSIVMILSIKLKRKWRREGAPDYQRPENLLLALVAYTVSLAFVIPFSMYLRGGQLTIAPFLGASITAVLGYFIGIYMDSDAKSSGISIPTAAWQGALQLAATLIASLGSPLPGLEGLSFHAFVAVQSALSGFLIGVLFQHFYKRTMPLANKADNSVAPGGIALVGSAL